MGKIWVEICLISARGLTRTSSLWKLQWFAVGWINPNNKYCTKVDASGNANPVWKTKFSALIDDSDSRFEDLALHVEVYSREPIFLREKLQGTATVVLKEFLDKRNKSSEGSKNVEEVGSFQLRKRSSNKPQGFIDVSIRISEEKDDEPSSYNSYQGDEVGIKLRTRNNGINLPPQIRGPENHRQSNPHYDYHQPTPINHYSGGPNYPSAGGAPIYQPPPTTQLPPGPSYHQPRTPPPPPPPSNVGFIPTFLPRTDHSQPSYINMPSSSSSSGAAHGQRNGPGFAMGLGAGALAAGAVIFGDDFISGFDLPTGLHDTSLTISTDPPF